MKGARMDLSICSYSFHRLLEAGKQDVFKFITDCKELGCTYLDPWNAHLAPLAAGDKRFNDAPEGELLTKEEEAYLKDVKAAAKKVNLPFGCIAVDGAHIYDAKPEVRKANRARAYRWLLISKTLGAKQVRIDAGGPPELPDNVLQIVGEGYRDLVPRARQAKLELLIENHWGPSNIPENVVKILNVAPGLGLLFDTNNWAPGMQQRGWEMCAKYARCTHVKTFAFDEQGNEPSVDIPKAMKLLVDTGYRGCWGIESCPKDGDEYAGVRKTIALMRRTFDQLGVK
jgi:sugar phosphate isomerase/epimerase